MSMPQRPAARDAVARMAAALAVLVGAGMISGVGWMVWFGSRKDLLAGYIFFGLLPFILGLWVLIGGFRLWAGNPTGAGVAKMALWLPLTLFVGAVGSTPFVAKSHEIVPFLIFFGSVSLVLLALVWLLGLAEKRLLVRGAKPTPLFSRVAK